MIPHATRIRGWVDDRKQVVRLTFLEDPSSETAVAQVALSAGDAVSLRDMLTRMLELPDEKQIN